MSRARALLLAALAALAPAALAAPGSLPARLAARDGRLVASLDVSAAFARVPERELGNGLTNVVAVYVSVLPAARDDAPALVYGRIIEILFDVWEESYSVTVKDPRAPQGLRLVVPDHRALRAFLSDEHDLDLGPLALVPDGPFVVEVRVEVNPVSKEQLLRTREFIANPSAGPHGGPSRSVLGAMASFLLREPDPGTDVTLLRSRRFERAEVAPR